MLRIEYHFYLRGNENILENAMNLELITLFQDVCSVQKGNQF
jgi:hypothetical protein